jgi:hypothetical protein
MLAHVLNALSSRDSEHPRFGPVSLAATWRIENLLCMISGLAACNSCEDLWPTAARQEGWSFVWVSAGTGCTHGAHAHAWCIGACVIVRVH